MSGTDIEYMNATAKKGETWNPWIGCTRVSLGCKNCWAGREEDGRFRYLGRCLRAGEDISRVLSRQERDYLEENAPAAWSGPYFFRGPVYQGDAVLQRPLHWRKPRQVFVGSRCDIFHDDIPFEKLDRLWAVMALCPQHTFQVLTKRPKRMLEYLSDYDRVTDGIANAWVDDMVGPTMGTIDIDDEWRRAHQISPAEAERRAGIRTDFYQGWYWKSANTLVDASKHMWPIPNVWLGVSVEDQQRAKERLDILCQCPAALRYVSVEPMLGFVDLNATSAGQILGPCDECGRWDSNINCESCAGTPSLNWVIVGGESGKGARPMNPAWARQARDQSAEAGVPFFFKQWGEWLPEDHVGGRLQPSNLSEYKVLGGRFDGQKVPGGYFADGVVIVRVGKKAAGRLLDGKLHDAMPEVPHA